jgi:hypothetical protein
MGQLQDSSSDLPASKLAELIERARAALEVRERARVPALDAEYLKKYAEAVRAEALRERAPSEAETLEQAAKILRDNGLDDTAVRHGMKWLHPAPAPYEQDTMSHEDAQADVFERVALDWYTDRREKPAVAELAALLRAKFGPAIEALTRGARAGHANELWALRPEMIAALAAVVRAQEAKR